MAVVNPYPVEAAQVAHDARLFPDRQALMRTLPMVGAHVAELGVLHGENAEFLLSLDPELIHLLDVNFDYLKAARPWLTIDPRVRMHLGDGATTLDKFNRLDWVYVDGDHDHDNAYRDGTAAMRVAPIVIFNDYTAWSPVERKEYGVMTAVNRLLVENPDWEVFGLALQRDGYHDLAIRRRA